MTQMNYSMKECAFMLGVSRPYLYKEVVAGALRPVWKTAPCDVAVKNLNIRRFLSLDLCLGRAVSICLGGDFGPR